MTKNHLMEEFAGFRIGDLVRKRTGYDWPGVIRTFTMVSTGAVTASVENRLSPGTTHVFPPSALMMETRTDQQLLDEVAGRLLTR